MKKQISKSPLILIAFISACILIIVLFTAYSSNIKSSSLITSYAKQSSKDMEIGKTQSIIEYGDQITLSVHYPITQLKKIDSHIYKYIADAISSFKAQYSDLKTNNQTNPISLHISYQSNVLNDNYASFAFHTQVVNGISKDTITKTFVFQLDNESLLSLDDIFTPNYTGTLIKATTPHLAKEIATINEITANTLQNNKDVFNSFYLADDFFEVHLPAGTLDKKQTGIKVVKINYKDLEPILKNTLHNNSTPTIPVKEVTAQLFPTAYTIQHQMRSTIDKSKPMVALTFDDGPYEKSTTSILNTLKEHDSVATFFFLGNRVSSYKEIVARAYNEGNQIGNHTYTHKDLLKLPKLEISKEIDDTQQIIFDSIGTYPNVFRPTYGNVNKLILETSKLPNILWTIDTLDWKTENPDDIVSSALKAKDGDIILMHDMYLKTAKAVEQIVPALKKRGFQLVTVDELFEAKGIPLTPSTKYFGAK